MTRSSDSSVGMKAAAPPLPGGEGAVMGCPADGARSGGGLGDEESAAGSATTTSARYAGAGSGGAPTATAGSWLPFEAAYWVGCKTASSPGEHSFSASVGGRVGGAAPACCCCVAPEDVDAAARDWTDL